MGSCYLARTTQQGVREGKLSKKVEL